MSLGQHQALEPFTFNWKCPKCGYVHVWKWEYIDIPMVGDEIRMECDHCGKHPKMVCKLVKR